MSPDTASKIDVLDIGQEVLLFVAIFVVPFFLMGSLLPAWMFYNSLQLIAHTPLISTLMPSNAHYFLMKYLNFVRITDYLDASSDVQEESSTGPSF